MKDGGKRKRNIEKAAEDDVGGKKMRSIAQCFIGQLLLCFIAT